MTVVPSGSWKVIVLSVFPGGQPLTPGLALAAAGWIPTGIPDQLCFSKTVWRSRSISVLGVFRFAIFYFLSPESQCKQAIDSFALPIFLPPLSVTVTSISPGLAVKSRVM